MRPSLVAFYGLALAPEKGRSTLQTVKGGGQVDYFFAISLVIQSILCGALMVTKLMAISIRSRPHTGGSHRTGSNSTSGDRSKLSAVRSDTVAGRCHDGRSQTANSVPNDRGLACTSDGADAERR